MVVSGVFTKIRQLVSSTFRAIWLNLATIRRSTLWQRHLGKVWWLSTVSSSFPCPLMPNRVITKLIRYGRSRLIWSRVVRAKVIPLIQWAFQFFKILDCLKCDHIKHLISYIDSIKLVLLRYYAIRIIMFQLMLIWIAKPEIAIRSIHLANIWQSPFFAKVRHGHSRSVLCNSLIFYLLEMELAEKMPLKCL